MAETIALFFICPVPSTMTVNRAFRGRLVRGTEEERSLTFPAGYTLAVAATAVAAVLLGGIDSGTSSLGMAPGACSPSPQAQGCASYDSLWGAEGVSFHPFLPPGILLGMELWLPNSCGWVVKGCPCCGKDS